MHPWAVGQAVGAENVHRRRVNALGKLGEGQPDERAVEGRGRLAQGGAVGHRADRGGLGPKVG